MHVKEKPDDDRVPKLSEASSSQGKEGQAVSQKVSGAVRTGDPGPLQWRLVRTTKRQEMICETKKE